MYAIIRAGGKQHKVAQGDVIQVELVSAESGTVEFTPLLVTDDDGRTRATAGDLEGATVRASVLGEVKGPKIDILRYRNKTGYRRHTGHRQRYTELKIDEIMVGGRARRTAKTTKEVTGDGS